MTDGRSPRAPGAPSRSSGQTPRPAGGPGRPSGSSHRTQSLKRKVVAAFTERLPFKATALFFALVLWLVVSAEEPTQGQVPVRFEPVVDTSLQLEGQLPDVSAYVVGTRSDLLRLTTTPPAIHYSVPPDAPDTLQVQLEPTMLTMPSGVNVSVRRIQPELVTLVFGGQLRRTLPVRSELRFMRDSLLRASGPPSFTPESVTVTGPRRRVRALEAVPTIATDVGVRDSQPILVPLDTSAIGVRVTPQQVRVRFPVSPVADTMPPAPLPPDTARAGAR